MTDGAANGNGHEPRDMVRFGERSNQELHLETAEEMLALLFARQPRIFGNYLQMALGIKDQ
jgi:hypothetical protein